MSTGGDSEQLGASADLAQTLSRIEARLTKLEQAVAPLAEMGQELPKLVATATDVLDEKAAQLGDLEARLSAAGDVVERLSRPQTLASLGKLVDIADNAPGLIATLTDIVDEKANALGDLEARLSAAGDVIERLSRPQTLASLGQLTDIADQAPKLIATLTDIVDEKATTLGDLEARLSAASDVVERLSRPQTLASLGQLVDVAEHAPALVATFTDVMDESMARAAAEGLELHQVVNDGRRLLMGLLRLTTSQELRALLDSGMLDPRALRSLGEVASALVEVREKPIPKAGVFGALRALGDPDVQRALGFVLELAQGVGRALGEEPPARQLPQAAE